MNDHEKMVETHQKIAEQNKISLVAKEIYNSQYNLQNITKILEKYFCDIVNYNSKESFERLSSPLIEFLNTNYHPHAKIIIETDSAEIVEGVHSFCTDEFIGD